MLWNQFIICALPCPWRLWSWFCRLLSSSIEPQKSWEMTICRLVPLINFLVTRQFNMHEYVYRVNCVWQNRFQFRTGFMMILWYLFTVCFDCWPVIVECVCVCVCINSMDCRRRCACWTEPSTSTAPSLYLILIPSIRLTGK